MDGWVSYFFTERPLRWGTSSLSYFFSNAVLRAAIPVRFCHNRLQTRRGVAVFNVRAALALGTRPRKSGAHLPKVLRSRQSVNVLKWKSSSRFTLLCAFCRRLSQIEARKQRSSFADHGSHFTEKKHRVSRQSVFTYEFTWWLAWLYVWYDDGHADHDNRP